MIECICRDIRYKEVEAIADEFLCTYWEALELLKKERGEGCGRCDTKSTDICPTCLMGMKGQLYCMTCSKHPNDFK